MIARGESFTDVMAEDYAPDEDELHPVFSEANLYGRMYKGDARFILSIAEEYERLIEVLGVEKVKELLS
jgi:hypothetical protein